MNGLGVLGGATDHARMQQQAALNAPRSLGFVERAAGIASGLEQLQDRLQSLLNRIDGNGEQGGIKSAAPIPGLGSQLSEAENNLRACMSLVDELHVRF